MTKMTNKKALGYVIDNYDLPDEVREKFEAMIAALDKKSSGERKPTAKQVANEGVRAALVEFINENSEGNGFTCSDLTKVCAVVEGKSNQYVSSILRKAIIAKELSKGTVKGRTYFAPVGVYEDEGREG